MQRLAFRGWLLSLALAVAPVGAVETGDVAPPLDLVDAEGGTFRLAAHAGEVVLLDFWASWCAPCRESFPFLDALHREHADAGLAVVGVNLDEQRADAERFLARYPVAFRIVYDPEASTPERYDVIAMPSSYLIGRDGTVRAVYAGFRERDKADLREAVRAALAEAAP